MNGFCLGLGYYVRIIFPLISFGFLSLIDILASLHYSFKCLIYFGMLGVYNVVSLQALPYYMYFFVIQKLLHLFHVIRDVQPEDENNVLVYIQHIYFQNYGFLSLQLSINLGENISCFCIHLFICRVYLPKKCLPHFPSFLFKDLAHFMFQPQLLFILGSR